MPAIEITFDVSISYRCSLDDLMLDRGDVSLADHPERLAAWIEELLTEGNQFEATDYSVIPASIAVKQAARA
jgi:hypothetical protein